MDTMKNKRRKQYTVLFALIPVVLFLLVSIPYLIKKEFVVFPHHSAVAYEITDEFDQGNSEILDVIDTEDTVCIRYILREGYEFPYAGIAVELHSGEDVSLAWSRVLEVQIKSRRKTSLRVNILTSADAGLSEHVGVKTDVVFFYYTAWIDVDTDYRTIRIPAHKFQVPEWWLTRYKMKRSSVPPISANEITKVEFLACNLDYLNTPLQFTVKHIGVKNNFRLYIYLLAALLVISIILAFVVYEIGISRRKTKEATDVIRIHKNLDLGNEQEREAAKVLKYLSKNYNAPYLSVQDVADELDISVYRVPKIVNSYTQLSFKKYINMLRIEEAKSQLINTNSKIIDIAYAVGYNSIAHFNKQFKLHESVSPTEYRHIHTGGE